MFTQRVISAIGQCSNPKFVVNKYTGQRIRVGCGHCSYCLNQRAKSQFRRTSLGATKFKYCYFVTLTYRNDTIPLYSVFGVNHSDDYADGEFGRYPFVNSEAVPFSDFRPQGDGASELFLFKQIQGTVKFDRNIKEYVPAETSFTMDYKLLKALLHKVQPDNDLPKDTIPFLNYVDVQNYVKRLRINLQRLGCDEKISFFVAGEYGPVHYRPHFHLLLFGNTEMFAQTVFDAHNKSWKFGRSDIQLAAGGSAQYTSAYISCANNAPLLYKVCNGFKPRARASKGFYKPFDIDADVNDEDSIARKFDNFIVGQDVRSGDSIVKFSAEPYYISTLLPRFTSLRPDDCVSAARVICAYAGLRKQFARRGYIDDPASVYGLACRYVDWLKEEYNDIVLIDSDRFLLVESRSLLASGSIRDFYHEQYLMRIYRTFLKCEKFLQAWKLDYLNFNQSLFDVCRRIFRVGFDRFQNARYDMLFEALSVQEEAEGEVPEYFFYSVTESPRSLPGKGTPEYQRCLDIWAYLKTDSDYKLRQKVKHKKLNDANKMFNY